MSQAVAQALQDADSLLAETRHATWNVRKGLEEESFLTLEALRDRKDSSIDVDDMLREYDEEGEVCIILSSDSPSIDFSGDSCDVTRNFQVGSNHALKRCFA